MSRKSIRPPADLPGDAEHRIVPDAVVRELYRKMLGVFYIEERLKILLGTRVRIVRQGTRGRIEIDFNSEDELIRIYEQLTRT